MDEPSNALTIKIPIQYREAVLDVLQHLQRELSGQSAAITDEDRIALLRAENAALRRQLAEHRGARLPVPTLPVEQGCAP